MMTSPERDVLMIRSAQSRDVAAIAAMHVRSWRRGFRDLIAEGSLTDVDIAERAAFWNAGLARPHTDAFTLVAETDSTIIGACHIQMSSTDEDITDPNVAEIVALYVDPGFWRTGAAKALLGQARQELKASRQRTWMLWTLAEHAGTRAFYSSEGFTPDLAHERRHRGTGLRLVRLRADLLLVTVGADLS